MARIIDFVIPRMGEPFDSARLVSWNLEPGQAFKRGDVLLEIETDKSVIEIPAPDDGKIIELLVKIDGLFSSDTPVARLEVNSESLSAEPPVPLKPAESDPAPSGTGAPLYERFRQPDISSQPELAENAPDRPRSIATPIAKRSAQEHRVALDKVSGTGPGGRITLTDVLHEVRSQQYGGTRPRSEQGANTGGRVDFAVSTSSGDMHISRWEPASPRNAPTVVLIHGIFGDIDTWSSVASMLIRAGLTVLAMDLPCHGKSTSTATNFSDIVDSLAEAITAVCPGPVVLVGHSLGGALSARLAHKPALNIHSLILIAPVGLGTEIQQEFLYGMIHAATNEALIRELNKLTVAGVSLSTTYLDELRVGFGQRTDALKVLCDGISRNGIQQINIVPDLQQMAVPVTVIHGRSDGIIPWQHALNAPAHIALHLAPGVGHMPQWDAAKLVGELIARLAT